MTELVKWNEENKKDLIRICNEVDRTHLSGRLPYPYTEESADWWYKNAVSGDGKDGIYRAISVDGKIVGNITVEPKGDIYCKDTELGYMLETAYHGKGIMTEAVRQICDIVFRVLDIERVTACICSVNIASQKVVLKNGFVLEGVLKQAVYKDGNFCDLYIYGKYRESKKNDLKLYASHPVFSTPDICKTAEFYVNKLGFRRVDYLDANEKHICLYRDEIEIILTQSNGQPVIPNRRLYGYGGDAYIIAKNQTALQAEYEEKGVNIVQPLHKTDYHNREFVIEDCDGRWLYFGMKCSGKLIL